jgi:hypothetical protein
MCACVCSGKINGHLGEGLDKILAIFKSISFNSNRFFQIYERLSMILKLA